jgi:hypothetical protein
MVAVAVSEKDRSGNIYLDVLQAVIVQDLSCDFLASQADAVFLTVETAVLNRKPAVDYQGYKTDDANQNTHNCKGGLQAGAKIHVTKIDDIHLYLPPSVLFYYFHG